MFIPGPVKVLPEVLEQLSRPTLGHRGKEYSQLHGETVDMLKKILYTDQNVFLSTSSASGVWEGSNPQLHPDGRKSSLHDVRCVQRQVRDSHTCMRQGM